MNVTFDESDYLCVVPFAWGRSKSPQDAYRVARANMPGEPYTGPRRKCQAILYRLSDAVDRVQVHDDGSFVMLAPENGDAPSGKHEARLVWRGYCNAKPESIPVDLIDSIE